MSPPTMPGRRHLMGSGAAWAAAQVLPADAEPAPWPQVDVGRLERAADLPASRHVAPRHVDVWLPPGFRPDRSHVVVYLHDGQMLFDPATTWNRQAWRVHLAVDALMRQRRIGPTMLVGIWSHTPERHAEYFPQAALDFATEAGRADFVRLEANGRAKADAYLRFIVEELKPWIDARYAPRPDREGTVVMGSSMGGLISLYALCEFPQVFGAAGALSAHWPGLSPRHGLDRVRNAEWPLALLQYLHRRLPPPGAHRLWVDRGDDALDSLYAPGLAMCNEVLRERGHTPATAATRVFAGTGHNETDWGRRAEEVLAFLISR